MTRTVVCIGGPKHTWSEEVVGKTKLVHHEAYHLGDLPSGDYLYELKTLTDEDTAIEVYVIDGMESSQIYNNAREIGLLNDVS